MNGLRKKYLDWMMKLVCDKRYMDRLSYDKLLLFLFDTSFYYILERDENRYEDGIDLRYRFGYEKGYPQAMIAGEIDIRDCSVLEMMIALAHRIEEQIVGDPDIGDRIGKWFWIMIENLGLIGMTDEKFDEGYCWDVLCRFLNRQYDPDGKGGLFPRIRSNRDMREVEIWYQAMWYLTETEY